MRALTRLRPIVGSLAIAALAACSSRDSGARSGDTAAVPPHAAGAPGADTTTHATSDTAAAGAAMAGMTGNPDHDFLRMMSNHHKGLILLAHEAIERKDTLAVKPDAQKLDREQDQEFDRMVTMLEQDFKDPYDPKVMPEHQAMADALAPLAGAAYDSTFRADVITHHREGIRMMDEFLPKLTRADLKAMVEKMKATQTKEIAEQERKLARL